MAQSKKTTVDKLGDTISGILKEYDGSIQTNLEIITKKMGQKGAAALRQQSKKTFKQHSGKYAKGWKYEFRKTKRMKTGKTIIFNDHYSLPHLLENEHVIRDGTERIVGHYDGRKHIEPIANKLVTEFEQEVISKL